MVVRRMKNKPSLCLGGRLTSRLSVCVGGFCRQLTLTNEMGRSTLKLLRTFIIGCTGLCKEGYFQIPCWIDLRSPDSINKNTCALCFTNIFYVRLSAIPRTRPICRASAVSLQRNSSSAQSLLPNMLEEHPLPGCTHHKRQG